MKRLKLLKTAQFHMTSLTALSINPLISRMKRLFRSNQQLYKIFGIAVVTTCGIATIDSIVSKPQTIIDLHDYYQMDSIREN